MTPAWWFVHIPCREKLVTWVCASEHVEPLSRMQMESGYGLGNCAAPVEPYFALSVSLHWRSSNSIWISSVAFFTSSVNWLLKRSNLDFWAYKCSVNSVSPVFQQNVCLETDWDLVWHGLATQKVSEALLHHLCLPQMQCMCLWSHGPTPEAGGGSVVCHGEMAGYTDTLDIKYYLAGPVSPMGLDFDISAVCGIHTLLRCSLYSVSFD